MSPKLKMIAAFTLVAVVGAGVAGGAVWWLYLSKVPAGGAAAAAPEKAAPSGKKGHKYLTLEKVIVMLRRNPGETAAHYLSTDLVVTTTEEHEKHTKEHLPLLRSIAVSALSDYTMEKASALSVAELAELLNKSFDAHYEHEKVEKPFSEVMIGKLIID